jgi:uncharacterized protein (TIRG00374 family)
VKSGRSTWKVGLRLAVGTLLLLWIFHTIFLLEGGRAWGEEGHSWDSLSRFEQWRIAWSYGPRELWQTMSLVSPAAFGASLFFMGMTIFLGVIRWQMVLRVHGLDLSFARSSEISLVAQFFNSFLLGATGGDVLKAYYAARETHHKKTEAVVTVLVDRLLGLFAMLLFACLMMLPNYSLLAAHRRLAALAMFILLMMLGCGVVIVLSLWGGLSRRWPEARDWLKRLPKGDLLERALEACRHFGRDWRFLAKMLAVSMALNVCCVLHIGAVASGLRLNINPLALFVIVPVIVCLSALPITPSGLGVRENLYVLMLEVPEINVPPASALSLSLIAYAGFLTWSVIGGIVYLTRKERDHLAEITRSENTPEEA